MTTVQSDKQCPGGSVGAFFRHNGKFLMLYRKSYPEGLAGIAGHIDEGETPEEALIREVLEESGLKVTAYTLVLNCVLPNPCKRGFTSHEWWLYEVTAWEGEPSVMEPDKHVFMEWMTEEEIRRYVREGDVDPAWAEHLLETFLSSRSVD